MSPDTYTVLSARRPIPVAPATSNGARSVSVCTSVGFRDLETTEYNRSIGILKPDAAVLMADILYRRADSAAGTSRRRMEKMGTRSVGWVRDAISELRGSGPEEEVTKQLPLLFAPILPIPIQYQLQYLDILTTDEAEGGVRPHISGIVLPTPPAAEEEKCDEVENGGSHDKSPGFWQDLPPELDDVARLSVAEVNTPHEILTHIQAGAVDIFTLSFVNQCTDAGVALTFEFKPTISEDCETTTTAATASTMAVKPRLPLGIDLWCTDHKADVSPLLSSCGCYTCTTHHRAYLHHCLDAKEMLAWTMLQIHNHAVVTRFFDAVRGAIIGADVMAREEGGVESRPGSETTTTTTGQKNDEKTLFDRLVDQFVATHESEMPMGTGRGPRYVHHFTDHSLIFDWQKQKRKKKNSSFQVEFRLLTTLKNVYRVRGYQFKSEGPGESKKNPLAYTGLGDDTSADAP